jgi:hypothetical protein
MKRLKKLILERRLAPCYPGADDAPAPGMLPEARARALTLSTAVAAAAARCAASAAAPLAGNLHAVDARRPRTSPLAPHASPSLVPGKPSRALNPADGGVPHLLPILPAAQHQPLLRQARLHRVFPAGARARLPDGASA